MEHRFDQIADATGRTASELVEETITRYLDELELQAGELQYSTHSLPAMSIALKHAEELGPGAYRFAILVRHDARDLVQMRQVVHSPGRQQFRQCHSAEPGMLPLARKIRATQFQTPQLGQVVLSGLRKLCQQLYEGTPSKTVDGGRSIQRLKRSTLSVLQDHRDPRHPIVVFAM